MLCHASTSLCVKHVSVVVLHVDVVSRVDIVVCNACVGCSVTRFVVVNVNHVLLTDPASYTPHSSTVQLVPGRSSYCSTRTSFLQLTTWSAV